MVKVDRGGPMSDLTTTTLTVSGMTCGHCVAAVTDELTRLAGVRTVEVDLGSGQVTIASDAPLDGPAVAAAVDEAGYEVVP
jgi:copper chaperone CopZ